MKIIIIGNGFDLNLGLKTSYNDFIESDYFISLVKKNNSLAKYLNYSNKLNNWVDIEKELSNYSMAMTVIQDENINIKDDFQIFKIALMDYLKEAQDGKINQKSKAFEMIKDEIETTNIIYNFNYTDSIFRVAELLGIDGIESKHSYVHGSVEKQDIIFGVEDRAKVDSKHIFFKKSYNKNFGKSNIGKFLKSDDDLVLFGHSLGITDSSYFQSYIYSLVHGDGSSELKFYHYGDVGYDAMMNIIDEYTLNNLTEFKNNNNFIPIDSSEK